MVSEALKGGLELDQAQDDVAVRFAWAAQDLAQPEAEAHGPTIGTAKPLPLRYFRSTRREGDPEAAPFGSLAVEQAG
jgi:hypothetical protein